MVSPQEDAISFDAIPTELRELNQWVCWEYGKRNGTITKRPKNPHRRDFASTTDPTTWGTSAADWMRQRPSAPSPPPGQILNIQADMTGIPMRPKELEGIKGKQHDGSAKTRQIKLGCVFTQSAILFAS